MGHRCIDGSRIRRNLVRGMALAVAAAALTVGTAPVAQADEIALTIVNVQTPQGVKIWVPESFFARKGDVVKLNLVNKLEAEHGYSIPAFDVEVVVPAGDSKEVEFEASETGLFKINCHLHPPHVVGQLVVFK